MSENVHNPIMNNTGYYYVNGGNNNDEIDLFDLLYKLWSRKLIILAVSLIATLFAGIYAFTVKEQWTAKVYICMPRIAQINDYLELRRAFSLVSGTDANVQNIANSLFADFIAMASSPDEKLAFLSHSDYFFEQTKNMDEISQRRWLSEMAEKGLTISPLDEKRNLPYFAISLTADNPRVAQAMLESYVQRINHKVIEQDDGEFRNKLAAMIQARKKEKQDIDFNLKANRNNQLANLERSLNTAQKAGIKNYYTNTSEKGSTKIELTNTVHQYMLGENFLSAEIQSLSDSPIIYPVRYYEIERELEMLEPLLKQQAGALSYRYQLSPGEYLKKDRPKRALILALGGILGVMVGVGFVLIHCSIKDFRRNRQRRSIAENIS